MINKWEKVGTKANKIKEAMKPAQQESGREKTVTVRIGQSSQRAAKAAAARQGQTLQSYIEALIAKDANGATA